MTTADAFGSLGLQSLKGKDVEFQGEGRGTITDETEDALHIISQFFTGWMYKAEFFDLLGIED